MCGDVRNGEAWRVTKCKGRANDDYKTLCTQKKPHPKREHRNTENIIKKQISITFLF